MNKLIIRIPKKEDLDDIINLVDDSWRVTYPQSVPPEGDKNEYITQEDIDQHIAQLQANPARRDTFAYTLFDQNIISLCAEINEQICGILVVKKNPSPYLHMLYVHPSFIGKGIGTLLLQKLSHIYPNFSDLSLSVASHNIDAIRFYKNANFIETNEETTPFLLKNGKTMKQITMRMNEKKTS